MSHPSGMIANPTNSVFYGIFTRAADLVAMGRAFDTIEPAFKTISLIKIRRRANTLKFRMTRGRRVPAVGWVPDEVWNMVKAFLIDESVMDARAELQEELCCDECEQRQIESRIRVAGKAGRRRSKYDDIADEVSQERFAYQQSSIDKVDWVDFADPNEPTCPHKHATAQVWTELVMETRSELLDSLLRAHGLRTGLNSPSTARRSATTTTLSIVQAEHWQNPHHPPPPDAERRIARLIDAWRVGATHEHAAPAGAAELAQARTPRIVAGNTSLRLYANLLGIR